MISVSLSNPHGDKLTALLDNAKLPLSDKPKVEHQLLIYSKWIDAMNAFKFEGDELLVALVNSLNQYKNSVELDLIFDSDDDFLYRQKGQLKLDNTILEEFLPRLFDARLIPGFTRLKGLECGPKASFAGLSFDSPVLPLSSGGAYLKKKDQDFSVTRRHKVKIERDGEINDFFSEEFHVSYFATEIKTNLDKTMFQEAAATASELKKATTGSRYILLCEWLDMTPISTKLTAIDEVIILRRAKRIGSGIRANFSSVEGRKAHREWFKEFLNKHPLSIDGFRRFVFHLNECFPTSDSEGEDYVLERGFF